MIFEQEILKLPQTIFDYDYHTIESIINCCSQTKV